MKRQRTGRGSVLLIQRLLIKIRVRRQKNVSVLRNVLFQFRLLLKRVFPSGQPV